MRRFGRGVNHHPVQGLKHLEFRLKIKYVENYATNYYNTFISSQEAFYEKIL